MRKIGWILIFFMMGCSTATVDKEQSLVLKSCCYEGSYKNTGKSIKVARPTLPLYLNSKEIVYVKGGVAKTYAHTFWGDLPSNFYRFMLLNKLEYSGLFTTVMTQGGVVDVDLILQSRIDEFEQIFEKGGVYAKISVDLTLLDVKGAKKLAHTKINVKKPLKNLKTKTLQATFEEALNQVSSQIVLWLSENLK